MRQRFLPVILSLGAVLVVAHALYMRDLYHGISLDDAYISYRYADHLARGQGLTFNPGERVEGYSNFLWVVLLASLVPLGGDLTLPSHVLGMACSVATLLLAGYALRRVFGVTHPLAGAGLMLLLAGSGYVAAWTVGGLEGPLFALLLLAAWLRYCIEMEAPGQRFPVSALIFAALALTRAEGVLLAAVAAVLHAAAALRSGRRPLSRATLLFPALLLGVVATYEIWRIAYYGPHLFPNAVRAKTGGGVAQALRGAAYVARHFLLPYALLLAPIFDRGAWKRPAFATGLGFFAGYLLFVAVAGGDWTEGRFFAHVLPLGALLFVAWLGTSPAVAHAIRSRPARTTLAVTGLAYVALTFLVTSVLREAPYRRATVDRDSERVVIGKWLAQNVPPDALLAVIAAGAMPYYSRLPTHDMYGLNDAHIAGLHMPYAGHGAPGHEKYDAAYTMSLRPDIIVDGVAIPGLIRSAAYMSSYHDVQHFWKYNHMAFHGRLLKRLGRSLSPASPRPSRP